MLLVLKYAVFLVVIVLIIWFLLSHIFGRQEVATAEVSSDFLAKQINNIRNETINKENIVFDICFRGYNMQQVDEVIDNLIKKIATLENDDHAV